MKLIRTIILLILLCSLTGNIMHAQSTFDPLRYKQFLEENKSMTSSELLTNHPPKTTYYSERAFPFLPKGISWYDSIDNVFHLTHAETELLSDNGFMVSQRLKYFSWADAFINIYSNDLPLFISTDFLLYTLHNSYDAILQTLEWQFLEPNLLKLLQAMYDAYPALYAKYSSDERFDDALADADLYISVALSLLNNTNYEPQHHGDAKYYEILMAIDDEQLKFMSLFTEESRQRKIDFSQFKPRGHYNKDIWTPKGPRTLENYFRAMMWLGRIDYLLTAPPENPWEKDWTRDELRRMQLGAVLLNELLFSCGQKHLLDKHEKIISFLVGPDDNLTPGELHALTSRLLLSPANLFNDSDFEIFTDSLNASDDYGQKIMSNFFYVNPDTTDPGKLPVSFKLLGQKFLIDSYIMSEVVYDRIVHNNIKIHRDLPDPLDVMAVLGNEDAMALLEDQMEEYKYAYKISSLKYLVDAYDEDFWEQSLYNTWLNSVRELNPLASSGNLPYFMKTTAWHHNKLNTQLTSWAQLRHDNILYGKQSYTGGTGCSFPYTYIEPYPEFYGRLKTFAENASGFFRDVLADDHFESKEGFIGYYTRYAEIMAILQTISEKELSGVALSDQEITFLKTMINGYMASGPSISGWYNDLFFDISGGLNWDYTVADVHTQPTDRSGNVVGNVLHVGNGNINMGVFLAPNPTNPDHLIAFAGPVSSFHYEVTGNFYRYTDQEWEKKFLWDQKAPSRPDWVAMYMADVNGELLPQGRELKGYINTEIYTGNADLIHSLDYLLAFPNPTSNVTHLRFVLNDKVPVNIELFDLSGRLVFQSYKDWMMPAEHDVSIDLSGRERGMYLLRFRAGDIVITKEIIVL